MEYSKQKLVYVLAIGHDRHMLAFGNIKQAVAYVNKTALGVGFEIADYQAVVRVLRQNKPWHYLHADVPLVLTPVHMVGRVVKSSRMVAVAGQ